mmetsp:Transcript_8008/g.10560  ORF Transcript_8008/g.10560 Transcript_8008/m.10560 type:complete len:227 (+) Transcript_8008:226-906(+)
MEITATNRHGSAGRPMKRTMIKDKIGTVRTSTYDLPGNEFTYGSQVRPDVEGAGAVLSKWVVGTPSQPKESQQSFIKTNRQATKQGYITAKQQRDFAKAHPEITFTPPALKKEREIAESKRRHFDGPFGMRTNADARESVNELIQAKYTSFHNDEQDYPDTSGMKKKGALPKPKSTIASRTLQEAGRRKMVTDQTNQSKEVFPAVGDEAFKMKKFKNVEARIGQTG